MSIDVPVSEANLLFKALTWHCSSPWPRARLENRHRDHPGAEIGRCLFPPV